jgi:hypothetical protein
MFNDLQMRLRWWVSEWQISPVEIVGCMNYLIAWVLEGGLRDDEEEDEEEEEVEDEEEGEE